MSNPNEHYTTAEQRSNYTRWFLSPGPAPPAATPPTYILQQREGSLLYHRSPLLYNNSLTGVQVDFFNSEGWQLAWFYSLLYHKGTT